MACFKDTDNASDEQLLESLNRIIFMDSADEQIYHLKLIIEVLKRIYPKFIDSKIKEERENGIGE